MEQFLNPDLVPKKPDLRRRMRLLRDNISLETQHISSKQLVAQLQQVLSVFSGIQSTCIAVYLAKGREVDIDSVARWLLQLGCDVVAPCNGTNAPFYRIAPDWQHFRLGDFGVREPETWPGGRVVAPELIDIVLVPGLAFDAQGNRLGQGGGWYDKVLRLAPQALKMGIAYECQLVPQVPHEAHDVRMDIIVTQARIIDIAGCL
jgi:5-formyltetrahydrofolate cyclo-ligase